MLDLADDLGKVEVRTPEGELEICIKLTPGGPVLTIAAARIELNAIEAVAIRCRDFDLQTTEGIRLESTGTIAVHSERDLRLDGERLLLNCDPEFSP